MANKKLTQGETCTLLIDFIKDNDIEEIGKHPSEEIIETLLAIRHHIKKRNSQSKSWMPKNDNSVYNQAIYDCLDYEEWTHSNELLRKVQDTLNDTATTFSKVTKCVNDLIKQGLVERTSLFVEPGPGQVNKRKLTAYRLKQEEDEEEEE